MEVKVLNREDSKKWILETCGKGWLNLIDIIYDNKPEHIAITEVFQKWGALTVRYHGEDEIFEELVETVESISKKMCEICGLSGEETVLGGDMLKLYVKIISTRPNTKSMLESL